MKKILILAMLAIVAAFGITFATQNSEVLRTNVELSYFMDLHWQGQLVTLVAIVLVLGIVLGYIASLPMMIRLRRQLGVTRKKLKQADRQIEQAREVAAVQTEEAPKELPRESTAS